MKTGFSLSPGGLLLPYHMGALHSLQQNGFLDPSTLIAGSSAGSIAAMAHGCNVHPYQVLEGTISISETCQQKYGRAHGKLLKELKHHMNSLVGEKEFLYLQEHSNIGIAYTQVFPFHESHLQTEFENRQDLFRAVSYSCMFPFFTAETPWLMDIRRDRKLPRLMMDGIFSVPWDRFGCPQLEGMTDKVDRTVAISVMPQHLLKWCMNGMGSFSRENVISPSLGGDEKNHDLVVHLGRLAVFPSSRKELTQLFDLGERDAELWCIDEKKLQREKDRRRRRIRNKVLNKYQYATATV
ncbi:MAG: hypothetical protein SGILL_005088 [Bacillariaceae sp.]